MLFIVAYAASLGVLIDLDHFVIARINTGSWTPLVAVIRSPVRSLRNQADIFPAAAVSREERVLTHLLVGTVLVAGLWTLRPEWGHITAIVLYLHLLADAFADVFELY